MSSVIIGFMLAFMIDTQRSVTTPHHMESFLMVWAVFSLMIWAIQSSSEN